MANHSKDMVISHKFLLFILCFLMTGFTPDLQAKIIICHKCGHELSDSSQFCGHCGEKRKGGGQSPDRPLLDRDQETAEPGESSESTRDLEVVETELKFAIGQLDKDNYELAYLVARNALAMNMLFDDPGRKRAQVIEDVIKRSRDHFKLIRRNCITCGGSGKRVLEREGLSKGSSSSGTLGSSSTTFQTNFKCQACNGEGTVVGEATMGEKVLARGQAIKVFHDAQKRRSFLPVGEVWIPMDWDAGLSTQDKVLLMRSVIPPCEDCMGFGEEPCKDCDSQGMIKCEADGCEAGFVEKSSSGLSGGTFTRKIKCKICNGKGQVRCSTCHGKSSTLCKECQGTGEPGLCKSCRGRGMSECRSCKGSGIRRDETCESCKGEKVVFCSRCKGSGHYAR